jgi:hypothetical protein
MMYCILLVPVNSDKSRNGAAKAFAQGINIRLGILRAKTDAQAAIRLLRCQTKRSKRTRGGFAV